MRKQFSTSIVGYNKEEVDRYLEELTKDYEEELRKKKDRMFELAQEARNLKRQNEELTQCIERFTNQEKYISRALIKAEQRAQAIVEEEQQKIRAEEEQLKIEKEKWSRKFREVRRELLEFEKTLVNLIERFRDDINYYAAKEISDTILINENTEEITTSGFQSSDGKLNALNESELSSIDEMLNMEKKKGKVIA
ncbi:MAG: DivIVA domain-containing protein [Caldicoprobacterales bacterium]|jgi:cell division initiation protein|nr:DivIVA domain-containing protein [Clostridiales bacterium]